MNAKKILAITGIIAASLATAIFIPGGTFIVLAKLFSRKRTEKELKERALREASKCIKQE